MNKTIYIGLTLSVCCMLITITGYSQLASEKVPQLADHELQRSQIAGRTYNHNVLVASNASRLASNSITASYAEDRIPASLRSRKILQPHPRNTNPTAVLPSNSPKLAGRGHPKRPPALPVVF